MAKLDTPSFYSHFAVIAATVSTCTIDLSIIHDIHRAGFARRVGRSPTYQSSVVVFHYGKLNKVQYKKLASSGELVGNFHHFSATAQIFWVPKTAMMIEADQAGLSTGGRQRASIAGDRLWISRAIIANWRA